MRRLSRAAVHKFRKPDLYYLPYRREVGSTETVSAPAKLSHEVRSCATRCDGQRQLRHLPSTCARGRSDGHSFRVQCAHNLLSMSYAASAIRRPRYFFVRHLSSVGRLCAHAGSHAGVSRQFQSRETFEGYLRRVSSGESRHAATTASKHARAFESSRDWPGAKLHDLS